MTWPFDGVAVGSDVPGAPGRVISLKGYDPLRHNLFGLDVLHQDQRWVDRAGGEHLLTAMTPDHRRNLLAYLCCRAARLALQDSLIMISGPFAPSGDAAIDACEDAANWQCDHPQEWLETTKLVSRLRDLVDADEAQRNVWDLETLAEAY